MKKNYLFIPFLVLIICSCGAVKEEAAKSTLEGTYKGEVQYNAKFSVLGLEIADQQHADKCLVMIFPNDKGASMTTEEGVVKLAGLKLLTNGVSFNIPKQVTTDKDKMQYHIAGNALFFDSEGFKSDGQFFEEQGLLQFSYSGYFIFEENGQQYEVPFDAVYEVTKQQSSD